MKVRQKLYLPFKRFIGIVGSLMGIIFCLGLLWWWIFVINLFVTNGHPFFRHARVGKNSKTFGLLKFRSFKNEADEELSSYEAQDKGLTTKFGRFLRKLSLDETPQLINILIGHMSFIGPRPLHDNAVDHVTIALRHENGADKIRPGLSGYAQTTNRLADPEEKAKLDGEYVQKMSFLFDISIFLKTLFHIGGSNKGK